MSYPAPPPKPDPLSAEERAEVERRVTAGEVTVCPTHMSATITGTARRRRKRIAARQKRFWLARRKRAGLVDQGTMP